MSNEINTNINDYSINELYILAEIDKNSTKEQINEHFTKIIQNYIKKQDYKLAQFFHDAKEKILDNLNKPNTNSNDKNDSNKLLETLYSEPLDQNLKEKITDRRQDFSIFNNGSNRPIMTQKRLGVSNNRPVEVSQDSLNPTLRQIITNNIYIDSSDRNNTVPYNQNIKDSNSITNFSINLTEPLNNVLSMRIESLNIPNSILTFDPWYSNNSFIIITASNREVLEGSYHQSDPNYSATKISIAPGTYNTPINFITQFNLDLSNCAPKFLKSNGPGSLRAYPPYPGKLLVQAHLIPSQSLSPKIVFINSSQYYVKIVFYETPGTGIYSITGLDSDISNCSVLDNTNNPCYSEAKYNNNLGYFMGYRVQNSLNSDKLINSDTNENQLQIIITPISPSLLANIQTRLSTLYSNLSNWDYIYNSNKYSKDVYELINLDCSLNPLSNCGWNIENSGAKYYNIANVPLKLHSTKYLYICVNDFQQNRPPNNIIRASEQITQLTVPSYINLHNYSTKTTRSERLEDLSAEIICDNSNNLGNPIVVPSFPRVITQNQIYSANQIINNNKKTISNTNETITDVLGIIPLNLNDRNIVVKSQNIFKSREYFGPIRLERLEIKLKNDKGNIVNLNGQDWGFNIVVEQLYQY